MNFYDMNKMLTTLILYFVWWSIGQAENCQKYDRPRFESEWCAIYDISYTSSNGLYCRDSFFFSLLLLLLFTSSSGFDHLKGPKSKRILQVLLICFFYFLDPYRRRSMWNVIHWINGRMHDSTWHRIHVTNKRFGLLFLASILFLSI